MFTRNHPLAYVHSLKAKMSHLLLVTATTETISPSDSAHYAHIDISHISTELWGNLVFSSADGAIILHMIK